MAGDPRIRASDEDRDRAAAALREHLAVGRLTLEEFNDRLDQAYAARTTGELDQLMADLPGADLQQLPGGSGGRPAGGPLSPRPPSGWPAPRRGPAVPRVARGLGIVARDQPRHVRDLDSQRGQRRAVVPVGSRPAGRPDAGALGHGAPPRAGGGGPAAARTTGTITGMTSAADRRGGGPRAGRLPSGGGLNGPGAGPGGPGSRRRAGPAATAPSRYDRRTCGAAR